MRRSDFESFDQTALFPIQTREASSTQTRAVFATAKAKTSEGMTVLYDRDGHAYVPDPDGSRLIHIRREALDLEADEPLSQDGFSPLKESDGFFPVDIYLEQAGVTKLATVRLKMIGYDQGNKQKKLFEDLDGMRYVATDPSNGAYVLFS